MSEVSWRRIWKPDLTSSSWQQLKNLRGDHVSEDSDSVFLVKSKFCNNSYEFLATDLTEFWYEKLDQANLQKRSEKLNPSIEAPLTKIVDQVKVSLQNPSNGTKFSLKKRKADIITLTLTSELAGLPFSWTFEAESADVSKGKEHLALPLMAMVGELSRQKQELFKLLAAKDKQINDYKAQGAKVTRKNYETAPFDDIAFNNSMLTSKGFEDEVKSFGERIFDTSSQDLYRHICTKQAWLKHGQQDLDDFDDHDHDMESGDTKGQGPSVPSVESWANRIPDSFAHRTNPPSSSPSKSSTSSSPVKHSPNSSPTKKSPSKNSSNESTPVKDTELLRRQALERKLEQEGTKHMEKAKKKKKLKL